MAIAVHEAAPHHLPPFIAAPGETDFLFVVIVCSVIAIVLIVGNFYFKLHALPESMAHRANSTQLQLVGVLSLLALFTHNNIFWIAALLIAALRVPDFSTPLTSIARSLGNLSDRMDRAGTFDARKEPDALVASPAEEPSTSPMVPHVLAASTESEAPPVPETPASHSTTDDRPKADEPSS